VINKYIECGIVINYQSIKRVFEFVLLSQLT